MTGPDVPLQATTPAESTAGNPIAGATLYVDPHSPAWQQVRDWRSSRPLDAAQVEKIASQPRALWFGSWNASVQEEVNRTTTTITDQGALPVLVAYNLPQRGCWGSAAGADAYRSWITAFADGIGDRAAVVILEPFALAELDCLSAPDRQTRFELLRFAVRTLKSRGRIVVYLDAGHAAWHAASVMAERLREASVDAADGFSLNVANYVHTERSVAYGVDISQLVGGKHFVVDTGRNGLGAAPDNQWCNPAGRALGAAPTTQTGHPLVDAFLWIKQPGESDGSCNGGPAAGEWWPEGALGLAQRSLLPAGGPFFHGAFLGDAVSNPQSIQGAIDAFGTLSGKRPALVKTFHTLECDFSSGGWCGQVLRKIAGAGATNYVALDLKWPGAPTTGVLDAINAGTADAALVRVARQLAGLGTPVLLEPGWEMNGNWNYAWQGVANGGANGGPRKYVAAWRRVVDIFRREGAANVRWVFNPNTTNPLTYQPTGSSHWNWYANYYPGDGYVDYVGAHGFNGSTAWGGEYQDFDALFDSAKADHMLSDLARRYPRKPIIIGEFATEEAPGRDKGQWIADAYRRLRAHPNVVGAVWFHMSKEADWRIDSSSSALRAYRAAMADRGIVTAYSEGSLASSSRLASR